MGAESQIAVIDDFFPHPQSGFRYEEFRSYLDAMPGLSVHATWPHLKWFGETRPAAAVFADYDRKHPAHAGRVHPLVDGTFPVADAYYLIFLSNIRDNLLKIEAQRRPFAFTMYPGGGFSIDKPEADQCMARVFGSPCFRKVIATQPLIRDYILDKGYCGPEQILYLQGGPIARSAFEPPPPKPRYGFAKAALDIAFVAAKYSPIGADKGYDLFVEMAQVLTALGIDARYHVVGNFDSDVLPLGAAAPRFRFYGFRRPDFFRDFYALMDLIVGPTRPFILPGAFDGFPTGACIEAGLQTVAIACTDPLGFNTIFNDGEDIVLVQPDRDDIVGHVLRLAQDPARLASIGENGRVALIAGFGWDAQMPPRLELLRQLPEA